MRPGPASAASTVNTSSAVMIRVAAHRPRRLPHARPARSPVRTASIASSSAALKSVAGHRPRGGRSAASNTDALQRGRELALLARRDRLVAGRDHDRGGNLDRLQPRPRVEAPELAAGLGDVAGRMALSSDSSQAVRRGSRRPIRRKPTGTRARGATDKRRTRTRPSPARRARLSGSCQCWAVPLSTTAAGDVRVVARDELRDRAAHRVADDRRRRDVQLRGAPPRRRRRSRRAGTVPAGAARGRGRGGRSRARGSRRRSRAPYAAHQLRSAVAIQPCSSITTGPSPPVSRRNNSPRPGTRTVRAGGISIGGSGGGGVVGIGGSYPSSYHGGSMAVVIASDLGKDIAGEPLLRGISFKLERRDRMTLSGPQRRRQDDAAADARRRGVGRLRRARAGEGRQGRAARPAPAARAVADAARLHPVGRARAGRDRAGARRARGGDGRRRPRRGDAEPLRRRPGAARARRRLPLARPGARDAARPRLPRRRGSRPAARHVLAAAS